MTHAGQESDERGVFLGNLERRRRRIERMGRLLGGRPQTLFNAETEQGRKKTVATEEDPGQQKKF